MASGEEVFHIHSISSLFQGKLKNYIECSQGGRDEEWWGGFHQPATAAKFQAGDAENESVGEKGEGLEGEKEMGGKRKTKTRHRITMRNSD